MLPGSSHSGCATASETATLSITLLCAAKCARNKANIGQDEQIPWRLKKISDGAISAAEVRVRRDRHSPFQNEESTRCTMLVVQRQQSERYAPDVRVSQTEEST